MRQPLRKFVCARATRGNAHTKTRKRVPTKSARDGHGPAAVARTCTAGGSAKLPTRTTSAAAALRDPAGARPPSPPRAPPPASLPPLLPSPLLPSSDSLADADSPPPLPLSAS
jgi:hypothetical protein